MTFNPPKTRGDTAIVIIGWNYRETKYTLVRGVDSNAATGITLTERKRYKHETRKHFGDDDSSYDDIGTAEIDACLVFFLFGG